MSLVRSHWGHQPRYVILVWFCHPCDTGHLGTICVICVQLPWLFAQLCVSACKGRAREEKYASKKTEVRQERLADVLLEWKQLLSKPATSQECAQPNLSHAVSCACISAVALADRAREPGFQPPTRTATMEPSTNWRTNVSSCKYSCDSSH